MTVSNDPKDLELLKLNHLLLLCQDTPLPPGIFEKKMVTGTIFCRCFLETLEKRKFASATTTTEVA